MFKLWWEDFKIWWSDFKRLSQIDWHWLFSWIFLYLGFITIDILHGSPASSSMLKYMGIFLCIIYARQKYRQDYLLLSALLFTFLADTILVWTHYEFLGVCIFCFAQLIHLLRLIQVKTKIITFISPAMFAFFVLAFLQPRYPPVYVVTILYAFLLVSNLVISRQNYRRSRQNFTARCAFYAFLCFVCCDFCVGLRHLMLDGLIGINFLPLIAFLVWVFYYPSQVLMANSSTKSPSDKIAKKSRLR